jgi:cytochrome c oxidase subunit IV
LDLSIPIAVPGQPKSGALGCSTVGIEAGQGFSAKAPLIEVARGEGEGERSAMSSAGTGHIVSPKIYVVIWLILLVFTGLTVFAAFQNFGILNPIIALTIAVTKATLVFLFFMHVKYSPKMIALVIGSGLFFLSILLVLTCADYISRSWTT